MSRYSISALNGEFISNHRTESGAVRQAQRLLRLAKRLGLEVALVVSEFGDKHAKIGRTISILSSLR